MKPASLCLERLPGSPRRGSSQSIIPQSMNRALLILPILAGSLLCGAFAAQAASVSPGQLAQSRRWAAAKFEAPQPPKPAPPGLVVLANYDAISRNARQGKPMRLAGKDYTRGIYCHAPSKILIRLPGPGQTFTALAGVDSNEQTSGGRGSVEFSVTVDGATKFRSAVVREGMAPVPLTVDLAGATEFLMQVSETPDGIACDQADWANAQVTLKDGRQLWVADLPDREKAHPQLFWADAPFSFTCGGKHSSELLKSWTLKRSARALDPRRTEHTLAWTDPAAALVLRCVAVEYLDFPVVEWTLYFKNTGASDSALLENIQALDVQLDPRSKGAFLLRHNAGSLADGNDYRPLETALKPGTTKRSGGSGGRPTNADWSYFNLETAASEGLILAVGWPGQWAGEFACDASGSLRIRAGQELTRFKLHAGEEVRSPLIALQFYGGDWISGQNVWRRWMTAHSMPKPGGKLPPPQFVASSSRQYDEMVKANETNQILFIDRYLAEGLKLDYWWMDAGWYINHGGGWPQVGTWMVDSNRFPRGLRAVSDYARQKGMKTVVWFEPERVTPGTWLATTHPEWVLGGAKGGLLNLGNDEARQWLVEHVDRMITEQGIGLYRQDFNMDPLSYWRANDAPDRQGITEIKHVTGYLAYWDELIRRHPDLLIDSCASGGRRNDLETMRRSVPLWRSDYAFECMGHQGMTLGISLWLPYHGTGTVAARNAGYYGSGKTPVEPYAFWSNVSPSLGFGVDMRVKDLDYPALRRLVAQWRQVIPNYYGDFYPLTPWSRDDSLWAAWQFDRPEAGTGLVQVFRRENSAYESARFKLRGLDPSALYRVETLDAPAAARDYTGATLMNPGLPVALATQPEAAVITYTKVGTGK